MIALSVGVDNSRFIPFYYEEFDKFLDCITNKTYSLGQFKDQHRTANNFEYATCIGLDFDGGWTLVEAKQAFKDYKHIIATTRNHQKLKNNKVEDRFRVILFLSEPITDPQVYKNTVKKLLKQYPQADKQCSDASRMFYKSNSIYHHSTTGQTIQPVATPESPPIEVNVTPFVDFGRIPAGWSNCKWALLNGMFNKGEGNWVMMTLATTCKRLGYTKMQAYYTCKSAYKARQERTGDDYDKNDLWREVIEPVYGADWKGAVYNCREPDTDLSNFCDSLGVHSCSTSKPAFNFNPVGVLLKEKPVVNWIVGGLLTQGGMSLIVGQPKSGKSTIVRQLAKCVSRGDKFLGREVKKGNVLYLALEEQESMLYEQFQKLGVNENDNIMLHVGSVMSDRAIDELREYLLDNKPSVLIIDTLFLLAHFENSNDYNEVYKVLGRFRDLARDTNCHILNVHHQNKSQAGASSIMGSTAILASMDCSMIFQRIDNTRKITTLQRGGQPFYDQPLKYDRETDSYELGELEVEF